MAILKNVAFTAFEFTMYDANGLPATGLTITAQRSIDGAAFAATANSATEVANGVYTINLAAADLNGNCITFRFTATGADAMLVTVFPGGETFDLNVKSSWDGLRILSVTLNLAMAAANVVVYRPFRVTRSFSAERMTIENGGTVSGNVRMGILDSAGVLLASTAATVHTGTNATQTIALSTPTVLSAGQYFMALSLDNTTGTFIGGTSSYEGLIHQGVRASTAGIVTTPTIVDITSSHLTNANSMPLFSVLGFTASQLVAP